jgi:hypothetical protein
MDSEKELETSTDEKIGGTEKTVEEPFGNDPGLAPPENVAPVAAGVPRNPDNKQDGKGKGKGKAQIKEDLKDDFKDDTKEDVKDVSQVAPRDEASQEPLPPRAQQAETPKNPADRMKFDLRRRSKSR